MRFVRYTLFLCLALAATACFGQREKLSEDDLQIVEKKWPQAKRSFTGLRSLVLHPGTGPLVDAGDKVSVLYVGKLMDGTVFDQAQDPASPFTFRVGRGQVIEGWEEGLQLMRLNEKRLFIVPFSMAYGVRGNPPKIPKEASLVFEVEVIKIEKP